MLFTDATIPTETPPLRACGSLVGQPAEVPITGNRDKRVVFGAINPATGAVWFDESARWNPGACRDHLRSIRRRRRGWRRVLFLDRGRPRTAKKSRARAVARGIERRFLPTACPELNPVEGLWRHVKGRVLANEPTPDLSDWLGRVYDERFQMTSTQRLQPTGVPSGNFWLPT